MLFFLTTANRQDIFGQKVIKAIRRDKYLGVILRKYQNTKVGLHKQKAKEGETDDNTQQT